MSATRTERLHAGICKRAYFAERQAAKRARQRGEPDAEPVKYVAVGKRKYPPICSVDGCGRLHLSRGFCDFHYHRHQKGQPLDLPPYALVGKTRGRIKRGDAVNVNHKL